MADEQESVASVEAETPIEAVETETEQPVNLQEAPQAETEETTAETTEVTEADEDFEDFEWNGKVLKAPKGLKDGVLMHADYTKKTQEVAATRKELEQRAAALDQQYQAADEELDLRASLKAIDAEIQQYANVDWQKLENEDIVGAQSHWRRLQQLKEAAQTGRAELDGKVSARSEVAQQETAKRLHETREFAEKKIPGWTPEIDAKVTEFATSELGFTRDMLLGAYTPQVYRALHLAWVGAAALQKQTTASKTPPQLQAKPLTIVGAKTNAPVAKSLYDKDLPMDEYVALRKKQMAAGR